MKLLGIKKSGEFSHLIFITGDVEIVYKRKRFTNLGYELVEIDFSDDFTVEEALEKMKENALFEEYWDKD